MDIFFKSKDFKIQSQTNLKSDYQLLSFLILGQFTLRYLQSKGIEKYIKNYKSKEIYEKSSKMAGL